MSTPSSKRGTGRTSRMLRYARREAEAGKEVLIIAANEGHARALQKLLHAHGYQTIRCESMKRLSIEWFGLQVDGVSRETVVLFDHYAIEYRLARALRELTRFDRDEEGEEV